MNQIDFAGQVAIVTGAGGGLGRSHAELLASRNARVVVNDIANAAEVVAAINAAGGEAIASADDISTPDGAANLVQSAIDEWGTLDILINNAGRARWSTFSETTPEEYALVRESQLDGTYFVTREAWPIMKANGYGRIVITSSGHGALGGASSISYATSKGGLYGMMRAAAIDGKDLGIMVNALAPAAFTPMAVEYVTPEFAKVMEEKMPASLVSPIVAVLASRECTVTGQFFDAGAGRVGTSYMVSAPGFYSRELTPEMLLENWEQVVSTDESRVYFASNESGELIEVAARMNQSR
jgi:NAD(P)-dependent dehydrogenase (short-subunit alcohol dehydrogenase family)